MLKCLPGLSKLFLSIQILSFHAMLTRILRQLLLQFS